MKFNNESRFALFVLCIVFLGLFFFYFHFEKKLKTKGDTELVKESAGNEPKKESGQVSPAEFFKFINKNIKKEPAKKPVDSVREKRNYLIAIAGNDDRWLYIDTLNGQKIVFGDLPRDTAILILIDRYLSLNNKRYEALRVLSKD